MKIVTVTGRDTYPDLQKSNVYIFDNLNNRHWDTWEDGSFDYVFLSKLNNGVVSDEKALYRVNPLIARKNLLAAKRTTPGDQTADWYLFSSIHHITCPYIKN